METATQSNPPTGCRHSQSVSESAATDLLARSRDSGDVPIQRIHSLEEAVAFEKKAKKESDDALAAILILLASMSRDADGILPIPRIPDAEAQIRGTLSQAVSHMRETYEPALLASAEDGSEAFTNDIGKAALFFAALALLLKQPSPALNVTRQILERGSRGIPFGDFAAGVVRDTAQTVRGILTRGATQEKPLTALRKEITQAVAGDKGRTFLTRLSGAGVTDIAFGYTETIRQWAEKSEGKVMLRWVLSERHRVKDLCDFYAGKLIEPDSSEAALIPLHLNCCCRFVPVVLDS